MKVAVYTIAKNEAKQVPSYVGSCRDADLVVVADTGSGDGTPDLLRRAGAVVHDIAVRPWRFDVARTTALSLLPADVDVCIKLDLDERLQPGWRAELERAWAPGTTRLRYWYTWNWKAPGVPDVVFRSDLIHARTGYHWRYPTHEILDHTVAEVMAESELAIHQYPEDKARPNDLPLLELAVREHRCPRTLFYLGREHSFREQWPACQKTLEEYLSLPDAHWTSERSHAMRLIGLCRKHQGDAAGALSWQLRACAEDASLRENWVELAQACHDARDWSGGYHACERALAISERRAITRASATPGANGPTIWRRCAPGTWVGRSGRPSTCGGLWPSTPATRGFRATHGTYCRNGRGATHRFSDGLFTVSSWAGCSESRPGPVRLGERRPNSGRCDPPPAALASVRLPIAFPCRPTPSGADRLR